MGLLSNLLTRGALTALLVVGGLQAEASEPSYPRTLAQYESIRFALATDDPAAARKASANFAETITEEKAGGPALIEPAQSLAASVMLVDARKQFLLVSVEIAKLVEGKPGFKIYTCPMLKGSVWVQTSDKITNPYFGNAMLGCGRLKK